MITLKKKIGPLLSLSEKSATLQLKAQLVTSEVEPGGFLPCNFSVLTDVRPRL